MFFHNYPYTDAHELNLDWLIAQIKAINSTLSNFIVMNTIKYADPFQWNITTQYESNTIVMDPVTGVAYISTKPVPAGISISNTDFWTAVFDLSLMFANYNDNITFNNEYLNIVSTHVYPAGSWLIWKNNLYLVTSAISLGDALQPGTNIERKTIEELVDAISTRLTNFMSYVNTAYIKAYETVSAMVADTEIQSGEYVKTLGYYAVNDAGNALYHIVSTMPSGHYETLSNGLYAELIVFDYVTPKMFGARGDGVTNDATALNKCVQALTSGGTIYIPEGTFFITDHFVVNKNNIKVTGVPGASVIKVGAWVDGIRVSDDTYPITTYVIKNIEISNITIDGNRDGYVNGPNDTYGNGINLNSVNDVIVKNCVVKDVAEQGIVETFWNNDLSEPYSKNIIIDGNAVYNCQNSRIAIGGEGHFSNGSIINNTVIRSSAGVGIELSNNGGGSPRYKNNIIRGNHLINTATSSIGIHIGEAQMDDVIEGNIIEGFEFGIRISCDSGSVGDVSISDNIIKNFGYGAVMVFPINNTDFEGCINDNMISSDQTSNSPYITIVGGGYVRDNTIIIKAGDCNGIQTGDGITVEGNTILHKNSATGYALYTTGTGNIFADNKYNNIIDIASGNTNINNHKIGTGYKAYFSASVTLDSSGAAEIPTVTVPTDVIVSVISTTADHLCHLFVDNANHYKVCVTDLAGTAITGSETILVYYENRSLYL